MCVKALMIIYYMQDRQPISMFYQYGMEEVIWLNGVVAHRWILKHWQFRGSVYSFVAISVDFAIYGLVWGTFIKLLYRFVIAECNTIYRYNLCRISDFWYRSACEANLIFWMWLTGMCRCICHVTYTFWNDYYLNVFYLSTTFVISKSNALQITTLQIELAAGCYIKVSGRFFRSTSMVVVEWPCIIIYINSMLILILILFLIFNSVV